MNIIKQIKLEGISHNSYNMGMKSISNVFGLSDDGDLYVRERFSTTIWYRWENLSWSERPQISFKHMQIIVKEFGNLLVFL